MPKIRNVSPLGDLWIASLRLDVAAGEVVEVSDDDAAGLLCQAENWVAVDDAAADVPATPES